MSYQYLLIDQPAPGVGRITLNRPDVLNALHPPLIGEIYQAADELAGNPEVHVVVYRGAGRAFCVGRDFKYSGELQTKDPEGWFAWRNRYQGFGPQTWTYPKATISQVHGYAFGGGETLAVGCDITIAAEGTKFGYPQARYGVLAGGYHMWNWLMGPKRTKEYLFTGRTFDAQEALTGGLINRVVPASELESAVLECATDIAQIEARNPGYIRANKLQVNGRHAELMALSSINPERLAQIPVEAAFTAATLRSQSEFYTKVAEEGMRAGLDSLHAGFASAPVDGSREEDGGSA